jgi:hypothetical protein
MCQNVPDSKSKDSRMLTVVMNCFKSCLLIVNMAVWYYKDVPKGVLWLQEEDTVKWSVNLCIPHVGLESLWFILQN